MPYLGLYCLISAFISLYWFLLSYPHCFLSHPSSYYLILAFIALFWWSFLANLHPRWESMPSVLYLIVEFDFSSIGSHYHLWLWNSIFHSLLYIETWLLPTYILEFGFMNFFSFITAYNIAPCLEPFQRRNNVICAETLSYLLITEIQKESSNLLLRFCLPNNYGVATAYCLHYCWEIHSSCLICSSASSKPSLLLDSSRCYCLDVGFQLIYTFVWLFVEPHIRSHARANVNSKNWSTILDRPEFFNMWIIFIPWHYIVLGFIEFFGSQLFIWKVVNRLLGPYSVKPIFIMCCPFYNRKQHL